MRFEASSEVPVSIQTMTARPLLAMALAALLTATACSAGGPAPAADRAGEAGDEARIEGTVLVFAAASLSDAFAELEQAFETAHPGADLQLYLAGSSALREQILEGAPADVYASANEANMAVIEGAGLLQGEPQIFVQNLLQIAVPAANPGQVSGLADFANDDLLIGLCAEGVPCGDFARQALANAGVEPSLDTNEPDVRDLLTKIAAGELDAGIVYVTDVIAAGDQVTGIDLPPEINVEASYTLAALAGAPNPLGAAAFVELVLSAGGQSTLATFGFTAP
jgi:molybdate transport system substrate-binding protein